MAERMASPIAGATIGLVASVLWVAFVVVALRAVDFVGAWIFVAAALSGVVSGATFGREVAARPSTGRVLGASLVSGLIGLAITAMAWALGGSDIANAAGWALYVIPAWLFALPPLSLGVWITRRLSRRREGAV